MGTTTESCSWSASRSTRVSGRAGSHLRPGQSLFWATNRIHAPGASKDQVRWSRPRPAQHHQAPISPPTPRPPELAERVWGRALQLARPFARNDRFALALSRAANHDPAAMAHALTLGRTQLRAHDDYGEALGGVTILEAVIARLGDVPVPGEVTTPRRDRAAPPAMVTARTGSPLTGSDPTTSAIGATITTVARPPLTELPPDEGRHLVTDPANPSERGQDRRLSDLARR